VQKCRHNSIEESMIAIFGSSLVKTDHVAGITDAFSRKSRLVNEVVWPYTDCMLCS